MLERRPANECKCQRHPCVRCARRLAACLGARTGHKQAPRRRTARRIVHGAFHSTRLDPTRLGLIHSSRINSRARGRRDGKAVACAHSLTHSLDRSPAWPLTHAHAGLPHPSRRRRHPLLTLLSTLPAPHPLPLPSLPSHSIPSHCCRGYLHPRHLVPSPIDHLLTTCTHTRTHSHVEQPLP